MPRYAHAIHIVIEAEDYEASMQIADDIAEGLCVEGEEAALLPYDHDNEGQRLVYLHGYDPLEEVE